MTNGKLNLEQVREIREKANSGTSYRKLGEEYGVSKTTISKLVRGENAGNDAGNSAPEPEQPQEAASEQPASEQPVEQPEEPQAAEPEPVAEEKQEEPQAEQPQKQEAPANSDKRQQKERTPHSVGATLRRFQRFYYHNGEPTNAQGRRDVLDKTVKGMEPEEIRAFAEFLGRSATYLRKMVEPEGGEQSQS